jgi:hypothetical protein
MGRVLEWVQKYREKLRIEGMRPIQIWVPDTRHSGFAEECRRQSLLVKHDPLEKELLTFLDEAGDREGWEA